MEAFSIIKHFLYYLEADYQLVTMLLFWDEYCINDSDFKISSRNVMGLTYLNAVKLESVGKGPRLFCDKSLVDAVDDEINKYIKLVDSEKEIYEIVWTIEGCEATGCCSSNKWSNVINRINDKMLPAAINLYKYYQKDKGLEPQYKELLNLVCVGIVKYAKDECNRENEAIHYINQVFQEKHIQVIDGSLLEDFIG